MAADVVFRSRSLFKKYGGTAALDNVNLIHQKARIYGLIGQNGAGKTTLMRIIAGLSFPTSGSISLFEQETHLNYVRKQCGFMIESSGLNGSMSAKDNILLHGLIKGVRLTGPDIDELLGLVGLENSKKKARSYSLGMKQRLGIALAMIGYPKYLVMDEPINGLDPVGVVEIRNMLKRLCAEKQMTILISSHNLPELYQTATDYIFIERGKIAEEITLEELEKRCQQYIYIETPERERAVELLEQIQPTPQYQVCDDRVIRIFGYCDRITEIATLFHKNNTLITTLTVQGTTLENYFLELIGGPDDARPA